MSGQAVDELEKGPLPLGGFDFPPNAHREGRRFSGLLPEGAPSQVAAGIVIGFAGYAGRER